MNQMIIRRLTIRNYRGVRRESFRFGNSLVVLSPERSKTVTKAIGILLKSEVLAGPPGQWEMEPGSELSAVVAMEEESVVVAAETDSETGEVSWRVTDQNGIDCTERFYKRIHIPPAEEKASCYLADRQYSEVLDSYMEKNRSPDPNLLPEETEGISNTSLFRQTARETVQECIKSKPDNIQVFVKVNALWQQVQSIRDLHHENWPTFVLETEKGSKESSIREFGKKRQLFLCRS